MQLLKTKGLATDEELKPLLDQAANTASVRWLGVRVRTESLLAKAMTGAGEPAEDSQASPEKETEKEERNPAQEKTMQDGEARKQEAPKGGAVNAGPEPATNSKGTASKPTAFDEDKKQMAPPAESQTKAANEPKENVA